jgi:hypothetical protein
VRDFSTPNNNVAAATVVARLVQWVTRRPLGTVVKSIILDLALIGAAPIAADAQTTAPPEPRSCQQLHEETNKCDAGMRSCDQRVIARLQPLCDRDQKRLPQVPGLRARRAAVGAGLRFWRAKLDNRKVANERKAYRSAMPLWELCGHTPRAAAPTPCSNISRGDSGWRSGQITSVVRYTATSAPGG